MPRLNILTDIEQLEFDCPPTLTVEARAAYVLQLTIHWTFK